MPQAPRAKDVTGIQVGPSLASRVASQGANPEDGDIVEFEDIGKEPEVQATQPEAKAEEPSAQDQVPDKFKDKSFQEVVSMYQNLETKFGQQGNDLGQMRKAYDQYLLNASKPQQSAAEPETTREPLTVDELLLDPETAINKAVANHPKIKQAEQTVQQQTAAAAASALKAKHADYESVWNSPEFASWLQDNPTMARVAYMGNLSYQPDDVAYVLDTYKAQTQQKQQSQQQQNEDALRKASVETHTAGTPVSSGERKVYYKRSDLLRLLETDRDKYDRMYPQIALAYKEGRVLD